MTLRDIGKSINIEHPQKVKHHLKQLQKKGLIKITEDKIEKVKAGLNSAINLVNIPILGSANCGEATLFAKENLEGYLKVSTNALKTNDIKDLFVLRTEGNSLNRANINGDNVEEGDYVIVTSKYPSPNTGDYIVTTIEGMANIKKYVYKANKGYIALISESTDEYPPVILTEHDNFQINGKVLQVIKI